MKGTIRCRILTGSPYLTEEELELIAERGRQWEAEIERVREQIAEQRRETDG